MKNLPNAVKWLIVVVVIAATFGILKYIDYRTTQAEMPEPEHWLVAAREDG